MPPDTEIAFNNCGLSNLFHRKHYCPGLMAFSTELINYQAAAISVLWYVHTIPRILTQWRIYVSSSSVAVWNPCRERCRHSCHSLLLQEAGQLQGLKTSQTNPLSHLSISALHSLVYQETQQRFHLF